MMKIRLLPLFIFLAVIAISFRIGAIWDSWKDHDPDSPSAGQAIAQDADALPPLPGDTGEPPVPLALDESDVPIIDGSEGMHPTELRLANSLANRRAAMDEQMRELDQREAMLRVVEERLEKKQRDLERLRNEIAALVEQYETIEDEERAKLQRVFSSMKPKKAAQIFNTMELETILNVIQNMSDRKLAPILESMNPEKAVIVAQEIDAREVLPELGQ